MVLTLMLLAGWEAFWRVKGFKPTINDDAGLWAASRRKVGPDSIVLVGSSRMHAAVHPSVFEVVAGGATIQLAITAGMSYPVLENLARDPAFRGTVICELSEVEITTGLTTELEKGYVNWYAHERLAGRSESFLKQTLQKRLVFASPKLSLHVLVESILGGQLPDPSTHYNVTEDRALLVDFSGLNIENLRTQVAAASVAQGPEVSPQEFISRARRFEVLGEEIERRGGRVIFVRLPVSGLLWERLEKAYPKASYWDEFARNTHFPTVHFKDYPDLQVECPDYSHLDMRDAPRFTTALARVIFGNR